MLRFNSVESQTCHLVHESAAAEAAHLTALATPLPARGGSALGPDGSRLSEERPFGSGLGAELGAVEAESGGPRSSASNEEPLSTSFVVRLPSRVIPSPPEACNALSISANRVLGLQETPERCVASAGPLAALHKVPLFDSELLPDSALQPPSAAVADALYW